MGDSTSYQRNSLILPNRTVSIDSAAWDFVRDSTERAFGVSQTDKFSNGAALQLDEKMVRGKQEGPSTSVENLYNLTTAGVYTAQQGRN